MKKTIALWLTPPLVFFVLMWSSQLGSTNYANPQAAMRQLVDSMKANDQGGVEKACTSQGMKQLSGMEKGSNFKNSGLYHYVQSRGFRFNPQLHNSFDIWRAWAQHNGADQFVARNSSYGNNAVEYEFQNDTAVFVFSKTMWSGWKLNLVIYPVTQ